MVASFNLMRQLCEEVGSIQAAIEKSEMLEMDESRRKVRRKQMPKLDQVSLTLDSRTIYIVLQV